MSAARDTSALRVATFNAHWCVGTDGVLDYARAGRAIAALNADVVCVQELHQRTSRFDDDQAAELARAANFDVALFGETMAGHPHGDASHPRRGRYGNAILLREAARCVAAPLKLPAGAGYSRSQEPRGAMAALVAAPDGGLWWVACTHLGCDLTGTEQAAAMPLLRTWVRGLHEQARAPVVLAGDFNACSARQSMRHARRDAWRDAWLERAADAGRTYVDGCTYPAWLPLCRIDYILMHRESCADVRCVDAVVTSTDASDHCPVCCTLEGPAHAPASLENV